MIIKYTDKVAGDVYHVAEIMTNRSMTVWEALEIVGVDMNTYADQHGWDGWDPEALDVEYN